jgi:hypothetical protein
VIDFRYHLVSIIAVFLALAVGLTVGATALSGLAEKALQAELRKVNQHDSSLTKDNKALNDEVNAAQVFAQVNSDRALGGILAGQKVVLVVAPGADTATTSGVTTALRQAGATVTGQVNLSQSFLDTTGRNESVLSQLAQRLQPTAKVTLPTSPVSSAAGQQAAAAVLSAAILTKDSAQGSASSTGSGLPASAVATIFSGFAQDGFLSLSGPNGSTSMASATLAVLIVPAGLPVAGSTSLAAAQVLPAVAQELKAAGRGTVMAGPVSAIASNSAISAENSAGQVSTVDNADTEIGAIMVAQALNLLLTGKGPAQYGVEPGTAPSPAPTPSATPTPSQSSSSPKATGSASSRSHK